MYDAGGILIRSILCWRAGARPLKSSFSLVIFIPVSKKPTIKSANDLQYINFDRCPICRK